MSTANDVALWMLGEFNRDGELYQNDAASGIQELFGDSFVYENENGNLAIGKDVLVEFRKLTEETAVWEQRDKYWRTREEYDSPTRRVE